MFDVGRWMFDVHSSLFLIKLAIFQASDPPAAGHLTFLLEQYRDDLMRKWLIDHPYFFTSAIFIVIIIVGWRILYWGWENFAFILLLYFIVTLGIRLDDISKKIGSGSKTVSPDSAEKDSILSQLNEIKLSLRSLDNTLKRAFERAQQKNSDQKNTD